QHASAPVPTRKAACWAFVVVTGRKARLPIGVLGQIAVLGLAMFALPFLIYPIGQTYITSGAAGIINAMTPIMVVIMSHFWPGGERATVLKSMGVACGFAGIVVLAAPALGEGSRLFGILFTVLAPVCYAFALNWVRRLAGIDQRVMLTWGLTFATLFAAPVALIFEGAPAALSRDAVLATLAIGPVLTSAAFILFYWLLPRVGATSLSSLTFIAPVSALLLAAFVLGEEMKSSYFVGMAAIFAGLLLIDGRIVRALRREPKVN
ncbi:MAG: DMT family transporter, partial [Pseudomonadota bacterium]